MSNDDGVRKRSNRAQRLHEIMRRPHRGRASYRHEILADVTEILRERDKAKAIPGSKTKKAINSPQKRQ